MNFVKVLLILFTQISFLLIFPIHNGLAEEQDMIIQTLPEKDFLTLKNMAPGRSETKNITIQNNGKNDFNYTTTFKLNTGSEKLYDELLLKVSKEDETLFKGNMKDFKKLDPRKLSKNTQEELVFQVSVPTTLENEFQGLACEVEITFRAEGILTELTGNGSTLPDTGTNIFNFFVTGTALLVCGLALMAYYSYRNQFRY